MLPSVTCVLVHSCNTARILLGLQIGEIKALAGVDFLTIAPALLEELKNSTAPVPKKLDARAGMYLVVSM